MPGSTWRRLHELALGLHGLVTTQDARGADWILPTCGKSYEGTPSTTVGRVLLDSRELIMRSRLVDAAHEARAEGLIRHRRFDEVIAQLEQAHA